MDMKKGYIKRLTKEEVVAPVARKWYLPRHPVVNPKKPGKVRRVCDAAAKFQGSSLNSHLLSGPDLLNNLVGIFMRFREEKVALSGDIEAMFNQVAVPEADQSALRFLWRQSPESPIEVYQYVRHIFGAKCAPTCSNYALLRSAEDKEMKFPIAALAVKRNFYMDDFFKSVKSIDEAMEIQRQLAKMLNLGSFHLTKWISNEKEVIAQIPEPERAPSVKVVDENIVMPVERALGNIWDTNSDCFVYEVAKRNIADTRRKMLSLTASLFDPIGFLAPFLVRAKILLQQVWHCGIGWDDLLPSELLKEWSKWQEELDGILQFRISRFYRHVPDSPSAIELHIFGDASEQAFCSVAYLRFCYASGAVKCAFVMAKTRYYTYAIYLSSIVNLSFSISIFTIVNCQSSILININDGSPGLPVTSITSGSRWLNGPAFLLLPEEKWPKGNSTLGPPKQYVDDPQTQETTVTCIGEVQDTKNQTEYFCPAKYSSLTKFLRVTAYLARFIYNCRHSKSERRIGALLVEDIEQARKFWVRSTQAESFPQEVVALKSKQHVSNKSKLVSLSPFLDEHGIVRAGGRIERADIPFCSRHPIVLSPDHEFTRVIIMNCHERLKHEGVDHVRNELRQQY
ncbi:uncharacterized protein [Montipora capricornis]|uniref:uncharacterized protein n=1 Tax=Montipora capricornis TaxID=246305 RepID=UPI0035F1B0B5